jgi:hypothetical protein
MASHLITYDLRDPSKEKDLLEFLRDTLDAEKVTESSYLATTDHDASEIVGEIRRITDDAIEVYVLRVDGWSGYGQRSVNEMLRRHLG